MSATATQTAQVNGESEYSPKFLPMVNAIPVVNSLKKQIFTHVPQAENLTKHVGQQLGAVFNSTKDTPIQPMLIKLDTLAANGFAKLEKEVPLVSSPTEEVLRKTKVDQLLEFVTHYYVYYLNSVLSILGAYKGAIDPVLNKGLGFAEHFLGVTSTPEETQVVRLTKLKETVVGKVDEQVTPFITYGKETTTSIYDQIIPIVQSPLKFFYSEKDKATEAYYTPLISNLKTRVTKAESAAKSAFNQHKPDISGPNAVIPLVKTTVFAVLVFGYSVVYPESNAPEPKKGGVEEQTNGLVSGVELPGDGSAKKRPNGSAN
jgi:hypothetical protein